ncbi:MAG: tRNA dihydrouridine synthase DusB [Clostridia bacterium]|nr:tRNA dihydrouridine synthase DusB [Clostridia bacterium]
MKIGEVELQNNLILAPMAGVTDLPFRLITKKYGNPGLVCNEMVSSKAICYEDTKTLAMLRTENESPISMQIFGSEPESMGKAALEVSKLCDILDINMGCPAPKVVKNGDGSKLLTDLGLARSVIQAVVQNSLKPVTLKIRKGWSNDNLVYKEISKIAEEEGIKAIVVHGRTRQEFYSGKADWNAIREVKENVSIPVIANGDIVDEESALQVFEQTGCDGIMIGRATLGNPWIVHRIAHFLETGEKLPEVSDEEKIRVLQEHFELLLAEKGEYTATREIRKFVAWYVKGMPDARRLKEKMNTIETKETFYQIF